MKKLFGLILSAALLAQIAGCEKVNEAVKTAAQSQAEKLSSGDMDAVHLAVFNTDGLKLDALKEVNSQNASGIMEKIFERVNVEVLSANDETVRLKVEAPDMSALFAEPELLSKSQFELVSYISEYVQNAQMKSVEIEVPYVLENDEPMLDYRNRDVMNAFTGGLVDVYAGLYEKLAENLDCEEAQQ